MHEAQTPEDGANIKNLNSVDSSESPSKTTNPFYSILAGENTAKELLLLAPASKELQPNQAVNYLNEEEEEVITEYIDAEVEIMIDSPVNQSFQLDEETNLENPPEDEWVAEPNVEQQAIINGEFQQLLKLNEELRSANNKLYEQVEQLTTSLSDSEVALQRQNKRSTVAESMLKQQTQELTAAQAQIQSLFEQLENTMQNVQRQENVAKSYRGQLEFSQQRLAQLERECVSIQTKYSEQSQLLSQSENVCRELRTRLKRQQRQTLQFKAALEKSLETSVPGYDTLEDSDSIFSDLITNSQVNKSKATQTISSIQSIQPWSAPPDSYKTQNDMWEEILATSSADNSQNPIESESSTWEFIANPNIEDEEATPDTQTQTENSVNHNLLHGDSADEQLTEQETDNQIASPSDSSELEDKLDSVIQTFFASQTESESQQSAQEQHTETDEVKVKPNQPVIPTWEPVIQTSDKNNDVINADTNQNLDSEDEQTISFTSSMNNSNFDEDETGDYWEEVSHFPAFDLSENATSFEILSDTDHHTSSPSPLIYPKRPPKGRKSLASVELPKFPDKNDGDNS